MKSFIIPTILAALSVSAVSNASTIYGEQSFSGKGQKVLGHNVLRRNMTFAPGRHAISLSTAKDEISNTVACVLLTPDGSRIASGGKHANADETINLSFNIKAKGVYTLLCEARIIVPLIDAPAMSFTYAGVIK